MLDNKREQIERMAARLNEVEDRERILAALEVFYNDEVTLDELIEDMRPILAEQRFNEGR
jgi:hypothetical protein